MKRFAAFFAGPVMTALGINHFVMPGVYESIIPDFLPAARALVYISGVAEIAGGLGTMYAPTRRAAGWFLIGTLVAIFPANVHMALNTERYPGVPGGTATLLARLPLQAVFIYLVYVATLKGEGDTDKSSGG